MSHANSKSSSVILSPRAIAFNHGTGAQLMYLLDEYPTATSINYGFYEKGIDDRADFLESSLHHYWPWRLRGRGFIRRISDKTPFAIWHDHQLTSRGKSLLRQMAGKLQANARIIAVVHDNNTARRVNSIVSQLSREYVVILYDLMHLEETSSDSLSDLASCISNASSVFAISGPLRDMARGLHAKCVLPISFYRPRSSVNPKKNKRTDVSREIKIAVIADAKPAAFDELLTAVSEFSSTDSSRGIQIHFIGNPGGMPELCRLRSADVTFHGFVSTVQRDEIGSRCDFAFLAGSTLSAEDCPLVKYSIPSKLGDFAALGLPVIARVASGSAAEIAIREEYQGFVKLATSSQEVISALKMLAGDIDLTNSMSAEAARFADERLYLPNSTTDDIFDRARLP
jgi:hypothetical protein